MFTFYKPVHYATSSELTVSFDNLFIEHRNLRTNMKKDIIIGSLFLTGIWGFISGAFIISTVMFGASAMFSNIFLRERLD